MAKLVTTDIASGSNLVTVYNANLDAIEAAMEKTLSRDGTAPNQMTSPLDLNSEKIINLATATADSDAMSLGQAASLVSTDTVLTADVIMPFVFTDTLQTLTDADAVDVTASTVTEIVTTTASALTMADAANDGIIKILVMKTDSGDATLTPTSVGNFVDIVFSKVGDSAFLWFTNAAWHFIGGTAHVRGNVQETRTLATGEATPTVKHGHQFKTAGTTAISDFDDGVVGQQITILAATSITITAGAPIQTKGDIDFEMVAGDTLTLHMFNDQVWEEIGRSVDALPFELLTTGTSLVAAQSGKTFYLDTAGGFTTTLPALAAGLEYTFKVKTAPTTLYAIVTAGSANIMAGMISDTTGESVAILTDDILTFVANTSLIGDSAHFLCDGVNWHIWAFSSANGGITSTQT